MLKRLPFNVAPNLLNQDFIVYEPNKFYVGYITYIGTDKGLIFHSDKGVQYASYDYQDLLRNNGFLQSMIAKGCCYDNACAESFFSSLKKYKLYGRLFKTRDDARIAVLEYIHSIIFLVSINSTLKVNKLHL